MNKMVCMIAAFVFALIAFTTHADEWSGSAGKIYYTGGNVGIGISNPQKTFHINGLGDDNIKLQVKCQFI